MGFHEDEDRKYAQDVQAVKNWWKDSRWRYTKRPFTAEQIVAKRGNLKIDYPSNVQAKKLWGILEQNYKVRSLRFCIFYHYLLTKCRATNRTSRPASPTAVWSRR